MSLFEITENDKRIYREELKDFLPERIFDVHAHVWLDSNIDPAENEPPEKKRVVTWPSLVAKDDPIEDFVETYRLLFPDKKLDALIFPNCKTSVKNNVYVAEKSKEYGFPALYYSHPEESADEIETRVREGHYLGTKSYLDLSPRYIPEPEIRIFDFFPKHQLERLNRMGAIVMLHIPRPGRLKDPVNIEQIAEIKTEFPDLRLIIAHIGRAYTHGDIGNAFERLGRFPDLMYDFTANCCEYAITEVLKHAGPEHLMYGSDMPITRMRTCRVEENGTYVNLVPPGLYGDVSVDPHLREVSAAEAEKITFFIYEQLLALKRAAKTLNLSAHDVENVMYGNARNIVDGARRSIYGE